METLLITGAGGLIGTPIVRQLAAEGKYRIVAATSGRRPVVFPEGVVPETVNLLDEAEQHALLERVCPDILIHLAWSLDGPGFLSSEKNIQWLEASLSLMRAFRGKSFLFAGSSAEYGHGMNCKETDMCHPTSLYGECKLAFERVAASYCGNMGIRFVGMRFFSVYGPGDCRKGRALPTAIQSFLNKEPFTCKGPNNTWDYIFTEDIGKAVSKIINSKYSGPLNISTGQAISMKQVFTEMSCIMETEDLLSFKNEDLAGQQLVGDNSLLWEQTGFCDFTPFEEGMKKTVEWWRDQQARTL